MPPVTQRQSQVSNARVRNEIEGIEPVRRVGEAKARGRADKIGRIENREGGW
jgi:hypothetical protein